MPEPLLDELRAIVGEDHVLADAALRAAYETDWTRRWHGSARAVVRPADTGEVAGVVSACAAHGAAIVPQGGNTGLVGGGVPRGGEIVLSLRRLDGLEPVDAAAAAQVTAGAGVTLAALQAHARGAGLAFGVDLGARDSATVGGMIATNAGGVHVLRHGSIRRQVLGVEAVLADGRVLRRMAGLPKDNTGYDLPGLLVGSEGTLGVVTAARLRLVPDPPKRVVALVGLPDVEAALALYAAARAAVPELDAAELFFAEELDLVREVTGLPAPLAGTFAAWLLIEVAGTADPAPMLAEVLGDVPAAVGIERPDRERLWAYRERITESISALGVPHKLDVTVPLRLLPTFLARLDPAVQGAAPGARTLRFGHLGDGNVHVNVLGPAAGDATADDAVLRLVAELGGSISAEHGIGVAKRDWLRLTRSAVDLDAMRAIKAALDPRGILNPGVLWPPPVDHPPT